MAGQPQPAGPVAVRRLWPGLYPQGETFDLPAGQAEAAIAAGLVFPVLPAGETDIVGPLATMIRNRLEHDAELAGLMTTATKYAWRTRNVGLMRSVLLRQLRPSDFTPERFRAEYGERPPDGWYSRPPQWNGGTHDPRTICLAHHLRRRRDELLVDVFGGILDGRLAATGFLPATGARTAVRPIYGRSLRPSRSICAPVPS